VRTGAGDRLDQMIASDEQRAPSEGRARRPLPARRRCSAARPGCSW